MERKFGLCVFIEESFSDATFKVMASFEDSFKAGLFCCFLFILSTQKSIERTRSVSVPEGCFHLQNHEIQNYEENRKQVGTTFLERSSSHSFPRWNKKD